MIAKYITTLAIAVVLLTLAASYLQFATQSQVLSGNTVDEGLKFEFTMDAGNDQSYIVTPEIAQFLDDRIGFPTNGPARIVAKKVIVTPKDVSWSENHRNFTSTGAAIDVQLQWDTPSDSANGARSTIYLDFPPIPGLELRTPTFHSGGYERDDAGRFVVREATTYRSAFLLSLARFVFALGAGLPFGVLLHSICWAFLLKGEKRERVAAFPPQGAGLPRTFYPNPVAEWSIWLFVLGLGSVGACVVAGLSVADRFMSSSSSTAVYVIVAIAAVIAVPSAYFTGRRLLTVRVDRDGLSYARGRGDLKWLPAAWGDILLMTQKWRTYRGNTTHWIEVEFRDARKKLKIGQSIEGYAALRDLLFSPTADGKTGRISA